MLDNTVTLDLEVDQIRKIWSSGLGGCQSLFCLHLSTETRITDSAIQRVL